MTFDGLVRSVVSRLARRGWLRLARLLVRAAGPPTDRAHLLLDPREGDGCAEYTPDRPMYADCSTDGHYLCAECGRAVSEDD